jgi:hypothetical protein
LRNGGCPAVSSNDLRRGRSRTIDGTVRINGVITINGTSAIIGATMIVIMGTVGKALVPRSLVGLRHRPMLATDPHWLDLDLR